MPHFHGSEKYKMHTVSGRAAGVELVPGLCLPRELSLPSGGDSEVRASVLDLNLSSPSVANKNTLTQGKEAGRRFVSEHLQ